MEGNHLTSSCQWCERAGELQQGLTLKSTSFQELGEGSYRAHTGMETIR